MIDIKSVVTPTSKLAKFSHYCSNTLYYKVEYEGNEYQFPIDASYEETGTAVFEHEMRAITLMRYIRKSIEKDEFVKIRKIL